ncbi:AAA family ATPase [Blattabacterium cuenoti]|uniref:AAA family ATPase n=1 Tax=Blattabacterium cuenoti TaxID=1653831 RepID=UPI00293BD6D4|nr:AAA family ATPase [Blattabacterium cuenoti]
MMNKITFVNYMLSDKYTPLKWNDVIGQKDIIINLKKAIEKNCLSQILFFIGPKGVGKNTCARILANELKYNSKLETFHIFEIHKILNNNSEDKIINQVKSISNNKNINIFIINDLNLFSQYFSNFILKFIKEKHSHILFIFCATEENKIPELILSRSQVYEFKSISIKEIFFHLKMIADKENVEIENEALFVLSQYVEGSLSKAIFIFDKFFLNKKKLTKNMIMKKLGLIDLKYYFEIVDYLLNKKMHKILITLDEIFQEKIDFYNLLIGFINHFRNLFLSKNSDTISILKFNKKTIQSYIEQSKKISYLFLVNILNICIRWEKEYNNKKLNKNCRLIIEIYLIQLYHLFSNNKEKKESKEILSSLQEEEKISFLQKNWIQFIQNFSEKVDPIYLDFFKKKIQFQIKKNKIFLIIPYELENKEFLLIQNHFEKYLKNKLNCPNLEFKRISKESNESQIKEYNFLYKKNKFVGTLVKRLNLKISPIQGEKKTL